MHNHHPRLPHASFRKNFTIRNVNKMIETILETAHRATTPPIHAIIGDNAHRSTWNATSRVAQTPTSKAMRFVTSVDATLIKKELHQLYMPATTARATSAFGDAANQAFVAVHRSEHLSIALRRGCVRLCVVPARRLVEAPAVRGCCNFSDAELNELGVRETWSSRCKFVAVCKHNQLQNCQGRVSC